MNNYLCFFIIIGIDIFFIAKTRIYQNYYFWIFLFLETFFDFFMKLGYHGKGEYSSGINAMGLILFLGTVALSFFSGWKIAILVFVTFFLLGNNLNLLLVGHILGKKLIIGNEDSRISQYIKFYWILKRYNPDLSERQLLEKVADLHIEYSYAPSSVKLGKEYLNEVFEGNDIDIIWLISHFIMCEFPQKYPFDEDIYEMERRIRSGKKTKKEILCEKIKKISDDMNITLVQR